MWDSEVVIVFQLGDSFPRDQFIEDEIGRRTSLACLSYREILDRYQSGLRMRRIATRLATLRRVLADLKGRPVILVGRSSGARVITRLAAEGSAQIRGVVCVSYPFRRPGARLDPDRIDHLRQLATPTVIYQGAQDEYGDVKAAAAYGLSARITLVAIPGEHEFRRELFPWDDLMTRLEAMAAAAPPALCNGAARGRLRKGPPLLLDPPGWVDLRDRAKAAARRLAATLRRRPA